MAATMPKSIIGARNMSREKKGLEDSRGRKHP